MPKFILHIILLGIAMQLNSCVKKPNVEEFTNICKRGLNAEPLGGDCTSNWQLNNKFTKWECNLFNNNTVTTTDTAIKDVACYPNANNGSFYLSLLAEDSTYIITYRLINKNLDLIAQGNEALKKYNTILFDVRDEVQNGDYLRLYYMLTNATGKVLRGYGNISIIK
jgi:hypothetical protein